jgi:hypothetical protein
MKKIESDFVFPFLIQRSYRATRNYNMQTETTQATQPQALDILQQFDQMLKNHSIVVSDRENLAKLFENIFDLCTQTTKTKLKAAVKAATQEPNTKTKAAPKPRAPRAAPKAQAQEPMVGPEGAADAPVSSDLQKAPVARGRGRPRKNQADAAVSVKTADANPNAETAEKKRRGRPKKDKAVNISSNDDEDALIEQMMADVASMQADVVVVPTVPATSHMDDDDATESEGEMSPKVHEPKSQLPAFVVEADVPSNAVKAVKEVKEVKPKAVKEVKEVKPKAVKEVKPKAVVKSKAVKEVKPKAVKAVKEAKPVKEAKSKAVKKAANEANEANETNTNAVQQPLATFSQAMPAVVIPKTESHEVNGTIYLHPNFPASSFSWNGKTYLRTELDNVYDNLTLEMVGVWDHVNHEVISAFDDDELYFSDEE